jgi:hypothetical protein
MNSRLGAMFAVYVFMAAPAVWADDAVPPASSTAESQQSNAHAPDKQATTPQSLCVRECTRSNARCSADVRHARGQCSRSAANEGEDPMMGGGRRSVEGFCDYFRNASSCNSKNADRHCLERFRARYNLCLAQVRPNVMSSSYDCFQEERQAEGMCRSELNDCKAACYQ